MPQVQMPDGTPVEMPDQLDPATGARLRAFQASQESPGPRPWQEGDEIPEGQHAVTIDGKKELRKNFTFSDALGSLKGLAETGLGGVAEVGSDVVGGLGGVLSGTRALIEGRDPMEDAAKTFEGVKAFSRTPQKSEDQMRTEDLLGHALSPVTSRLAPVVKSAREGLSEMGPAAETFLPALGEALLTAGPLAMGRKPLAEAVNRAVVDVPEDNTNPAIRRAREAGFSVRPTDVKAASSADTKVPGRLREKMNSQGLREDLTNTNQSRATQLAIEDIEMTGSRYADDATLEKARAPHEKTYQEAEKALNVVPTPPEFDALLQEARARAMMPKGSDTGVTRTIGALRRKAAKQIQNDDVKIEEQGFMNQEMADRLEAAMGERLGQLGNPEMLTRYRGARKSLAKIHNVDTASRAGQVDPQILFKLKTKGVPLTGRLKIIADAAEALPGVMQSGLKTATREVPRERVNLLNALPRLGEALAQKIPGLDVRSEKFQRQFGAPNEARSSYFDSYGETPEFSAPRPPPAPQLGTGDVEMAPMRPPIPPLASELARDLELVPDEVPNPDIESVVLQSEPDLVELLLGHDEFLPQDIRFRANRVVGNPITEHPSKLPGRK